MRDDDLRAVCFRALDALRAQRGDEVPYSRCTRLATRFERFVAAR